MDKVSKIKSGKSAAAEAADSTDGLIQRRKCSDDSSAGSSSEGGESRDTWDNKAQYILAVVGFAVGLGNVWRFPYLAEKNGGGAFLIPYTLMLAIVGIPLFYLELAVGQRLRKGAIGAWNEISPYLVGIGIASCVVSFWVSFYYNTIISWCLVYLVHSFRSPLPWSTCPVTEIGNSTVVVPECKLSGAPSYFWYRETLNISADVNIGGQVNWWIVVGLAAAWLIVFLCMVKGIGSSGKVVYFTATFPYLVLTIFFIRGITLEGFHHGVIRFFVPDFSRLADPQVWLEAATQIFFSLGLAFGGLLAFASYMPVRNNCYRDAVMVSVINCGTSVFAGVVVFSILGFKATQNFKACEAARSAEVFRLFNTTEVVAPTAGSVTNFTMYNETSGTWYRVMGEMPQLDTCDIQKELDKTASGTGLAFIAFTEAINQFPVPQLWSVLFFLMLLTLGLDSMFGMLEGVVTSIVDMRLHPRIKCVHVAGVLCFVSFIMSLCFTNQAGEYVFVLFDNYSGNLPLLIIGLAEVLAITWVYGMKRFCDDIELMTHQRPNYYWMICWKYVSPAAMTIILLASLSDIMGGATYEAWSATTAEKITTAWPGWSMFLAAVLVLSPVLCIPALAIVKYCRLYQWKEEIPALFPRQELEQELSRGLKSRFSTWEARLFYWMPRFSLANEMEDEDVTSYDVTDDAISTESPVEITITPAE